METISVLLEKVTFFKNFMKNTEGYCFNNNSYISKLINLLNDFLRKKQKQIFF